MLDIYKSTVNLTHTQDENTQGTTIKDKHVVDTPNAPAKKITTEATASLLKEYVGAVDITYRPWQNDRYVRSLPNPSDELMSSFGSRIYEVDMPIDPQVSSTGSILVMSLLCQGLKLELPVDQDTPNYKEATVIMEFLNHNLENLRHSLPEIMYELSDGMLKMGHKVGELIFEQRPVTIGDQKNKTRILLVDIKTKPHEATSFVVDAFNNVLGLMYLPAGQSTLASQILKLEDLKGTDKNGNPVMIPRQKFIIPTHKPKNGDPRGTSHYRSAYTPWWKKQMWNPQHLAYVTRFAQPSIVAKLPEGAKDIPVRNQNNQIIGTTSIIDATNTALAKIKGGAVGSFVDTDVDMLEASSDGKVIFDSYDHEDKQIAKAMLMQTLTTEEGQHMARAASSIHQDVFGILIAFLRETIEWTVRHDILIPLVRYNFGPEEADTLTPFVSLGDTLAQDIPSLMSAIAQLAGAEGGIHESQWPRIWAMLNLPKANMDEWQRDREDARQQKAEMAETAKKAALMPPATPGARPKAGVVKVPAGSRAKAEKAPAPSGRKVRT